MGTARDGLRPLEAASPAASIVVAQRRHQIEARHRINAGDRISLGPSRRVPHDEISPERHRQRLDAPAYVRQRIDDLYRTLIGADAKKAPF